MGRTVKCSYGKCLCNDKEIDMEKAVQEKNKYYHPRCLKTKNEIKEIIDLFSKHINSHPVYSQLQSVITNIVFTKGIGSEYLLFGLRYYIDNKIPLNYPQGLYYVVQNKDVKNAYGLQKKKEINRTNIEIKESDDEEFEFKPTKTVEFEDIIRK